MPHIGRPLPSGLTSARPYVQFSLRFCWRNEKDQNNKQSLGSRFENFSIYFMLPYTDVANPTTILVSNLVLPYMGICLWKIWYVYFLQLPLITLCKYSYK